MSKHEQAIQGAIDHSTSRNEIAIMSAGTRGEAQELVDELQTAALLADLEYDSVDTGETIEVWAYDPSTVDDSMTWRVEVRYGSAA